MDNNNENYNNNSNKPPPYQHKSLKGINWVIFPQNQYVQLESPLIIVLFYDVNSCVPYEVLNWCFIWPYMTYVSSFDCLCKPCALT